MRIGALLCRLRQLHNTGLLRLPETSSVARSVRTLALSPRVADSSGAKWVYPNASLGNVSIVMPEIGGVRCMGIGSHKEGNRSGQHGVHYPHAKPDGSPEKDEENAREQFLEKAKAESASNIDGAQEQKTGDATTELNFGVKDGKNTDEAIGHASEELFKRSTINAQSSESAETNEKKDSEYAEVSSEAWASKDQEGGAHAVLDDSNEVDRRGQEDESVLQGQRTHTDEASASGETARENIDRTRSEMRAGKARSPQAGVRVGNVPAAGANAIDNEGDIPQFSKEQQETGDVTLDKAQKSYEQAIAGFGTEGDKNLQDKA